MSDDPTTDPTSPAAETDNEDQAALEVPTAEAPPAEAPPAEAPPAEPPAAEPPAAEPLVTDEAAAEAAAPEPPAEEPEPPAEAPEPPAEPPAEAPEAPATPPEPPAADEPATPEAPAPSSGRGPAESSITPPAPGEDYQAKEVVVHDDLEGDFASFIEATMVEFDDGDIVTGHVVKVDKDEVLLDIGYKSEGVIPIKELSIRSDVDPNEVVSVGDEIEALVLQKEDADGRLILSKKRAQYERAWGNIEKIKNEEGVVTGAVIEVVKGGLIIDIGLRGFLPASLVELRRVRDLQPYVGRELTCKIIELERNRNNVVLSRRAFLEETQKEQREDFLTNLKPGERRKGVVSSVVNFGAFVDLGGMDGLIHVSELSWKHVDHPSSVVTVGDEVEVEVLDVDLDRERISLSLKATQQDPWLEFASSHRVDELVYGRVTKLVPFGSFVQVGEGIEGLVHISEMAEHHVETADQVVTVGEELWVKIVDLDLDRRRISLSIKQAAEGGQVAEEYRDVYGEHAFDEEGNYIGPPVAEGEEEPHPPGIEDHGQSPESGEEHTESSDSAPEAEGVQGEAVEVVQDEAVEVVQDEAVEVAESEPVVSDAVPSD